MGVRQPALSAPPATCLYRHALESIFGMLALDDLSRILAVSRSWAAAVKSMKPIDTTMEREYNRPFHAGSAFSLLPPVRSIVASPLMRHLAGIHIGVCSNHWTPLDNASVALLAHHALNLTSLRCGLELTPDEPLILPAKLNSLQLRIRDGPTDAEINGVLSTLAGLPSLSRLCLAHCVFADENVVQLSILADCPSLTDLALESFNGCSPCFSDDQVGQIRSYLGHLQRFSSPRMESNDLARLLQPPVTARWRDIGSVQADEGTGELLLRLPTLTKLSLTYEWAAAHVNFLPQLPLLTTLTLDTEREGDWMIPADALLASLTRCIDVTELHLLSGFNSAQWSALFAKLTIKKLTIRGIGMDTLRCFSDGPITQSLEELVLADFALSPSEVSHLYALRRLRILDLSESFSTCLDDATVVGLNPPTPLLPALTTWIYGRTVTYASFEWMQQRRVH